MPAQDQDPSADSSLHDEQNRHRESTQKKSVGSEESHRRTPREGGEASPFERNQFRVSSIRQCAWQSLDLPVCVSFSLTVCLSVLPWMPQLDQLWSSTMEQGTHLSIFLPLCKMCYLHHSSFFYAKNMKFTIIIVIFSVKKCASMFLLFFLCSVHTHRLSSPLLYVQIWYFLCFIFCFYCSIMEIEVSQILLLFFMMNCLVPICLPFLLFLRYAHDGKNFQLAFSAYANIDDEKNLLNCSLFYLLQFVDDKNFGLAFLLFFCFF